MSSVERLKRFYACFSGDDRVLILINADPDAIASAMAMKRLLWRKVSQSAIAHVNVIKRPDNLSMVRLLGVDMSYFEDINPYRYTKYVLVDSQPDHHECFSLFKPVVVIDHHPISCGVGQYVDIRPQYGSTSTIMTEYLRAAKIKPTTKLATGLFYAIKNDTNNFKRQTQMADIRAFQHLFKFANPYLERRIDQADLRMDFLPHFERAIRDRVLRRGRMFIHLGMIQNPDICVLVADFMMRVNTVNWAIVSGICSDTLTVVFRNDGIRKNAGRVAAESFKAYGSAGGHKTMARAEIPVRNITGSVDWERPYGIGHWVIERVEKRAGK